MEDQIMVTKSGKEIVISQEFKDMLSSLPKEIDILVPHVYQYKGFWFDPIYLHGLLACHQHFQPKSTRVLLATPPKSGTTWFKGILYTLLNRSVHPPQQKNHPLLACNPHGLVPFLETLDPARFNLPVASCHFPFSTLPDSVKDHASDCKIVYVCRGIKDTFVSLWNFSNKAKRRPEPISLNEAFDLFCKGVSIFGPIWEHILEYWEESIKRPNKVLVIKYEEAKAQPEVELRRLADFLGCPFSKDEEKTGVIDQIIKLCSFGNMSKLEVNLTGKCVAGLTNDVFFRKGEVGDWEKHLTPKMAAKLDAITHQKFNGCALLP